MRLTVQDWLGIIGCGASVVGLAVSLYTLYKVANLPEALKQHSRDRHLVDLIDKIGRLPASKPIITDSTAREVEFIIATARAYFVSRWPFRQRSLKSLLSALEGEIQDQKRRVTIQNQLRLLRNEISIR